MLQNWTIPRKLRLEFKDSSPCEANLDRMPTGTNDSELGPYRRGILLFLVRMDFKLGQSHLGKQLTVRLARVFRLGIHRRSENQLNSNIG